MPKKQSGEVIVESHQHYWFLPSMDRLSEERCKCGQIKIGSQEFRRRQDEWNNYYQMCTETKSYNNYMKMKDAVSRKHKEAIQILRDEIMEDYVETTNEFGEKVIEIKDKTMLIIKPNFPDPSWFKYTVID